MMDRFAVPPRRGVASPSGVAPQAMRNYGLPAPPSSGTSSSNRGRGEAIVENATRRAYGGFAQSPVIAMGFDAPDAVQRHLAMKATMYSNNDGNAMPGATLTTATGVGRGLAGARVADVDEGSGQPCLHPIPSSHSLLQPSGSLLLAKRSPNTAAVHVTMVPASPDLTTPSHPTRPVPRGHGITQLNSGNSNRVDVAAGPSQQGAMDQVCQSPLLAPSSNHHLASSHIAPTLGMAGRGPTTTTTASCTTTEQQTDVHTSNDHPFTNSGEQRHHSPPTSINESTRVQVERVAASEREAATMTSQRGGVARDRLVGLKLCKGRFMAVSRVGAGSFGVLFSGTDTWSGKEVAIKFELVRSHQRQLLFESRVYALLHNDPAGFHPTVTRYVAPGAQLTTTAIAAPTASTDDSVAPSETSELAPSSVREGGPLGARTRGNNGGANNQLHPTLSFRSQTSSMGNLRGGGVVGRGGRAGGGGGIHVVASSTNGTYNSHMSGYSSNETGRKVGKGGGTISQSQRHGAPMEFTSMKEVIGFPRCYYYGTEGEYNVMVMDLLGPNLEDLFRYCNRHFSIKTICLLADQMLHRIEYLHHVGFIHRDLKPENFVMGNSPERGHVLYLIDFGLSKRYWDARLKQHIPYKEGVALTGTARYCSINAHLGTQQSRRDDLESLGYILLYFLKNGMLPWQGIRGVTDPHTKNVRISEKKISTSLEQLCKDEPPQMYRYMKYVRDLKFDEAPDYRTCREFFAQMLERHGGDRDWIFDWITQRENERRIEAKRHRKAAVTAAAAASDLAERQVESTINASTSINESDVPVLASNA